ncbi:MAG: hypothetical protein CL610_15345 [Anaerolineaceae bacterium]|nr:hypothetical protein [Anaerolineaceae bacterium]
MKPTAGKRDAGGRRTQIAQPRQRVGHGIVEIDEDGRQRQQVAFTAAPVARQSTPPQSDGNERAPTEPVGCQQFPQRVNQQIGSIEWDVTRRGAMLSIRMDGG